MNGKTIKAFRLTHGLQQQELCELLGGMAKATLSAYETGRNPMSKTFKAKFAKLVDEYGVDYSYADSISNRVEGVRVKKKTVVKEVSSQEKRPASSHYHTGSIDVWSFAKENFKSNEVMAFHAINAIKYVTRFGKKDGYNITDLEKAKVSIDEMIKLAKEAK